MAKITRFKSKYKSIELVAEPNSKVKMHSLYAKDIDDAMKRAATTFQITYERDRSIAGTDFYYVSRKSISTNLPTSGRMKLMLGHYLCALIKTQVKDKFIEQWITSIPDSDNTKAYFMFSDEKRNWANLAEDNVQKNGADSQTGKVKEFSGDPIAVPNTYEQWVMNLNAATKQMFNNFMLTESSTPIAYKNKINSVDDFIFVLCRQLVIKKDDHRFASFLISAIKDFISIYVELFDSTYMDGSISNYEYLDVKEFNLDEALNDPTKLLLLFEAYHMEKVKKDAILNAKEIYKLNFESGFKIDKGIVTVDTSVFTKIIEHAINGSLSMSLNAMKFKNQFEKFAEQAVEMSLNNQVLKENNVKDYLGEEFDIFIGYEDFTVKGKIEELENAVKFFITTNDVCFSEFKEFVRDVYYPTEGIQLPNSSIITSIRNGIPVIYRIDFYSVNKKAYLQCKVTKSQANGVCVDVISPFSLSSKEKKSFKTLVEYEWYKKIEEGQEYYGSCNLSENEKKFFVNQFRNVKVYKSDLDEFKFEFDKNFLTIMPPMQAPRKLDVALSQGIRAVPGREYVLREIDIQDINKISMLDIWFAYRKNEIDNIAQLESLYEKRLNLLGTTFVESPTVRLSNIGNFEIQTPNYGLLLNVQGAGSLLSCKSKNVRVKHYGYDPDNLFKHSKSKSYLVSRKLKVSVPVSKKSVNSVYVKQLQKDNILYASGVSRFNEPMITLYANEYPDPTYKDCYTCSILLDLAFDVKFQNLEYREIRDDKVNLVFKSGIPGFDSVDPVFDERMVIIDEKGKPVDDWFRFVTDINNYLYQTPSSLDSSDNHDVFYCYLNCLSNAFLECIHSNKVKEFQKAVVDMNQWMSKRILPSRKTELSGSSLIVNSINVDDLDKAVTDVKNRNDAIKLYKEIFGASDLDCQKVPVQCYGSYTDILADVFEGIVRPITSLNQVEDVNLMLPNHVVKDPMSLKQLITLFTIEEVKKLNLF